MPQSGQIITDHLYPYNKVVVNDYTGYTPVFPEESDDSNKMLFVISSPKGRDRKMTTITGGLKEFVDLYGQGPFSLYGQPYLNAFNALKTGNIVAHVLRVTAKNANYAYISIDALYKIDEIGKMTLKFKKSTSHNTLTDLEDITYEDWNPGSGEVTPPVPPSPSDPDTEEISKEEIDQILSGIRSGARSVAPMSLAADDGSDEDTPSTGDNTTTTTPSEDTTDTPTETEPDPDEGFTRIPFITVAALGRGIYGRKLRFGLSNNLGSDKENDFKNYIFYVYEDQGTIVQKESYAVCFNEFAIVNDKSLFVDGVVNDPDTGSPRIKIVTNIAALEEIYNAYKDANPDTAFTLDDFDPLLGIDKYSRGGSIKNLVIDTMSDDVVVFNSANGIALEGGSDGDLDESNDTETRNAALNAAYLAAFKGETDPLIRSKNRFPTHLILDANYDVETKQEMAALAARRNDAMLILDCGTTIKTKRAPINYVRNNLDMYVRGYNMQVDAICGSVRDPYSKKIVTVTNTYLLAEVFPNSWANNGGKHIPVAGNQYGVIDGFIKNSIYPVYDEDLDSDIMDELCEERINFARVNSRQEIVRATQTTRQEKSSNLSEANNVFILLDIKRDCEMLCDTYQYNFAEMSDIARFNKDAESLLYVYGNAQVRSISASFDKNSWEAERGILHLYVEIVHKDLVKTSIIEIDVNRSSETTE